MSNNKAICIMACAMLITQALVCYGAAYAAWYL